MNILKTFVRNFWNSWKLTKTQWQNEFCLSSSQTNQVPTSVIEFDWRHTKNKKRKVKVLHILLSFVMPAATSTSLQHRHSLSGGIPLVYFGKIQKYTYAWRLCFSLAGKHFLLENILEIWWYCTRSLIFSRLKI